METLAGAQVVGDYYYDWDASVTSAATTNPSSGHSGTASVGFGGNDDPNNTAGTYAHILWNDQPSSIGAGAYTLAASAAWDSVCEDHTTYTLNPSDSLTVNKPTISGFSNNNSFWNLGPGSSDPQASYGGAQFNQSVALTFNTNCGSGDTCNDTPQWALTTQNNQTNLSRNSGAQVTLQTGSSPGNCAYDSGLSASIGGFSSDNYAILVNSPSFIVHVASSDSTVGINNPPTGYITEWTIGVEDACSPGNGVPQMPMSESFTGSGTAAPGTTGWNIPNSAPMSWDIGAWNSEYTFQDGIGTVCSTCTPPSTWTSGNPPFTYNVVLFSQSHLFQAGTTSSASGWQVYNGTIEFYQDHGDNTCAILSAANWELIRWVAVSLWREAPF